MTTQTLAADVLDALLTVWRADATLAAYGTGQLRIYDGAPLLDRAAPIELWVGSTGIADEETVITGTQEWATFGDAPDDREETLDIQNAVWVAVGSTNLQDARRTAITVFNAAVTAVRGSNLGLAALDPTVAVTTWQLRQGQYTSGAAVVLPFTLRVTGQL